MLKKANNTVNWYFVDDCTGNIAEPLCLENEIVLYLHNCLREDSLYTEMEIDVSDLEIEKVLDSVCEYLESEGYEGTFYVDFDHEPKNYKALIEACCITDEGECHDDAFRVEINKNVLGSFESLSTEYEASKHKMLISVLIKTAIIQQAKLID